MRLKNLAPVLAFLLLTGILSAQTSGTVAGRIIDSATGEPVFGANVIIRSQNAFTQTDFDGKYQLSVAPGTHQLEIQMVGFDTVRRTVDVAAGQRRSVNVTLGVQTLDTVEVKGRSLNNTEAALLQLQKKAGTVSDGISEESIKKSPDSSAGDVLKRVTGITLIGGKYVFVRGLGERYSNTMLNGALLPSPEPDQRVVPMDLFPASLIKNIRIIKTFTPENPGEFSGGLVQVETKEYPDQFVFSVGGGIGGNSNTTGKTFKQVRGGGNENLGLVDGDFFGFGSDSRSEPSTVGGYPDALLFEEGNRFGGLPTSFVSLMGGQFNQNWSPSVFDAKPDNSVSTTVGDSVDLLGTRFGYVVGSSYTRKWKKVQYEERRYTANSAGGTAMTPQFFTLNPIKDERRTEYTENILWGNNVNLAFEPINGQQLYSKTFYSVNSDNFYKESNFEQNYNNLKYQTTASGFLMREIVNQVFGGRHALEFSDTRRPHILTWNFSYAEANRVEPDLKWRVWEKDGSNLDNYLAVGDINEGRRYYSDTQDIGKTISLDYEIPFTQWDGLQSKFKIGGLAHDREKGFESSSYASALRTPLVVDQYPVGGEWALNPARYFDGTRDFAEVEVGFNGFNAVHKLHAYYAQVDMPLVNKLRFVGGGRYEDSYQKTRTFQKTKENEVASPHYGCEKLDPQIRRALAADGKYCDKYNNGVGEIATKDLLPSANVVYEYSKDVNFRLGYSETVTRPDLRELSDFAFTGEFKGDAVSGNFELDRTYIHNYDFRWEWYMTAIDYVGLGVFYKKITNPIEVIGYKTPEQTITYYKVNGLGADLKGVELDYRRDLLDWLRWEVNAYYIQSNVEVMTWIQKSMIVTGNVDPNSREAILQPTSLERKMQGQSDIVYNTNLTFFFDKEKNTGLGFYYNYFSDRIAAVGTAGAPDVVQKGAGVFDVVLTHNESDNLSFKVYAKNLLDTRFKQVQVDAARKGWNDALGYEALPEEMLYKSYREGVSYKASISYKF